MNKRTAPVRQASTWLALSMVVLLALAIYGNSLANGFIGDDKDQLLSNSLVNEHHATAVFGSGVWAFRGMRSNYYRPLQFLVYIGLHAVASYRAWPFHLFMMLLHAANAVLVYFLALLILARPRAALAASVLFAIHPIHTEVVDWIAALPDLMVTTFVVAGAFLFARQDGVTRGWRIAVHCALYLAALLTKETGIMLLPLYVAFERVVIGRPLRELRRNAALYGSMAAMLILYLAARWSALGGLAPAQQTFHHLSAAEFLLSAVVITGRYLEALVLPVGLNYFHVFHATQSLTPAFLLSAAILATIVASALLPKTPSPLSYGIVWIALTLLPALNLTGVGQNVFAERYLYLPSVGFVWIVGLAWDRCAARLPALAWSAGILILSVSAWEVFTRNSDWRDDLTLLQVTLAQSPEAGVLHNNLAGAYVQTNDFERALAEERLAVQYEPRSAPFHKNLGLLLMLRDSRSALPEFEEAYRLQPSDPQLPGLIADARAAAR